MKTTNLSFTYRLACFGLAALQIFALAACQGGTAPTPTASATVEPSATATLTPTQPSPTPEPSPTPTRTPRPTAVPAGYFRNDGAGFAVQFPSGWTEVGTIPNMTIYQDVKNDLALLVQSEYGEEPQAVKDAAGEFISALFGNPPIQYRNEGTTLLANEVEAESIDASVALGNDTHVLRFLYIHQGTRGYLFAIDATAKTFDSHQETFEKIASGITIFRPAPFGVDYSEALVQFGFEPSPEDLDPAVTSSSAEDYIGLIFSGLVRLTPQLQVIPDLAESWTISPDGKVYTFKLRADSKFSSGDVITAEDVKKSWERTTDPKLKSSLAASYLGDIVGVDERLKGKAKEISGVKVIDETTLEVTLDEAKPYFLAKLAYPTAYVIQPKQAKIVSSNWTLKAHATGPYQIKEYREGEGLLLERNPYYHTQPQVPYLAFTFSYREEAMDQYKEGTIDTLFLSYEEAKKINQPNDPLHEELVTTTMLCTDMLMLNNQQPPLDDPKVREALALAIDPAELVEDITDGMSLPAYSILPPAMPGFSPDLAVSRFDPEAAKAALAESKYGSSLPEIVFTVKGYAEDEREDVAFYVDSWKKNLGITVSVEFIDPQDWEKDIQDNPGHLVEMNWCADYPDPQNFTDFLFGEGSKFNWAGYQNEEIWARMAEARVELDPAKRLALYQEIEADLLEDGAAIPLAHSIRYVLVKPRVSGFVLPPMHVAVEQWLSLIPQP